MLKNSKIGPQIGHSRKKAKKNFFIPNSRNLGLPEKSFSHVPPDNYNTENSDKRKLPLQTKELLIPCGLEIPDLDLHSDIQFNWYLPDII